MEFDAVVILFDIYAQDYGGDDGNRAKNNLISLAKNKKLLPVVWKKINELVEMDPKSEEFIKKLEVCKKSRDNFIDKEREEKIKEKERQEKARKNKIEIKELLNKIKSLEYVRFRNFETEYALQSVCDQIIGGKLGPNDTLFYKTKTNEIILGTIDIFKQIFALMGHDVDAINNELRNNAIKQYSNHISRTNNVGSGNNVEVVNLGIVKKNYMFTVEFSKQPINSLEVSGEDITVSELPYFNKFIEFGENKIQEMIMSEIEKTKGNAITNFKTFHQIYPVSDKSFNINFKGQGMVSLVFDKRYISLFSKELKGLDISVTENYICSVCKNGNPVGSSYCKKCGIALNDNEISLLELTEVRELDRPDINEIMGQ